MHEERLALAVSPARTAVLGLQLMPFSLGHELLLYRNGNCLVKGEMGGPAFRGLSALPVAVDLLEAALICCQGWHDNQAAADDPLMGLKLAIWRRRVRGRLRYHLAEDVAAFLDYRANGSLEFPLSGVERTGEASRLPGAPFLLRLHQFLMIALRLPEAEAWDYPLGLAKMRWQAFAEEEGDMRIYNYAEAEFDRYVAEQEANHGSPPEGI